METKHTHIELRLLAAEALGWTEIAMIPCYELTFSNAGEWQREQTLTYMGFPPDSEEISEIPDPLEDRHDMESLLDTVEKAGATYAFSGALVSVLNAPNDSEEVWRTVRAKPETLVYCALVALEKIKP